MKAMFLYSKLTGTSKFLNKLDYIKARLSEKFDVLDMIETSTQEEFKKTVLLACKSYDYLIFVGGDGTVNSILNFIGDQEKKPILGYIPGGTICDFAKNFGLTKNIRKALNTIIDGEIDAVDVCKANDKYFSYVLACGVFSEISYSTKRKYKKHFGNLAYYTMAIGDAFASRKVKGILKCNGQTYNVSCPFLLILNGNHVGGFYVNFKNVINDGKFHIFITKPGMFNGLLHYLFFKVRTQKIITDEFTFTFANKVEDWCVDGERAVLNDVHVKCLPKFISLIVPKSIHNKLNKTNN